MRHAGGPLLRLDPFDVPTPDGVERAATLAEAVDGATLVLGLTGAKAARAIASDLAPLMGAAAVLADMNSGSARFKREVARALDGVAVADVAVMGSVPAYGCAYAADRQWRGVVGGGRGVPVTGRRGRGPRWRAGGGRHAQAGAERVDEGSGRTDRRGRRGGWARRLGARADRRRARRRRGLGRAPARQHAEARRPPLPGADGEFAATAVDDEGMVHQELIARLGMPLGELWNLHDHAQASRADGRWSSLVVVKPLHLTGGVGSPANATALR